MLIFNNTFLEDEQEIAEELHKITNMNRSVEQDTEDQVYESIVLAVKETEIENSHKVL